MTAIVLDASPETVKINSGLEVRDPEGAGVLISSEGGGDMRIKCSSGGSWQGELQIFDAPNTTPNDLDSGAGRKMATFSTSGIGFFGVPEVSQAERVGQLASTTTLEEVIEKVNALELILHNIGITR